MLTPIDDEELRKYLQVFATRPWPYFDERLLAFCTHHDENIRTRATTAVSKNKHPEIRKLSLDLLDTPLNQRNAIELLATNYEAGDEQRILELLDLPVDECQRHWTLMSLRNLAEKNPSSAHSSSLADLSTMRILAALVAIR